MRTSERSTSLLRFLIGVLATLGALSVWSRHAARPLAVAPLDCLELYSDGRCELFESRELRVRVTVPPGTRLFLWDRFLPIAAQEESASAGPEHKFFKLRLRPGVRDAWFIALSWRGVSRVRLPLAESTELPFLQQARLRWGAGGLNSTELAQLQAQLQEQLGAACSTAVQPVQCGPALGLLGNLQSDLSQTEQARQTLVSALLADRQEGRVSSELFHLQSLLDILGRRQAQDREAEALLRARHDLFEKLPCLKPWEALHQAILRFQRGDLKGALRAAEEGQRQATLFNDQPALITNQHEQAVILAHLGRFTEARAPLPGMLARTSDGCTRIRLLHLQGWIGILEAQALGRSGADIQPVLQPLLQAEREIGEQRCGDQRAQATILTDRAHAELLRENIDEATRYVQAARHKLGSDAELQWEWLDLEGHLALRRKQWPVAHSAFAQMLKLSTSSRRANAYESQLRALWGLALASEASDQQKSREYYAEARALLEQRALTMPLGSGHASYLGSYERGTQLELDLLLRQQQPEAALELIRKSRLRALRVLSRLERINRLDAQSAEQYERLLATYHQARRAHEELVVNWQFGAKDELPQLQAAVQAHESELWSFLTRAGEPQRAGQEIALRPIPERELLLACHPKTQGWLCLLAHAGGILDVLPTAAAPTQRDISQLLAGLKSTPAAFDRLRLLPFGALRDLDVSQIPFWQKGERLGANIDVVSGLDLPADWPSAAPANTAPPHAFVLTDPDRDVDGVRYSAATISHNLRSAGWQVELQEGLTEPLPSRDRSEASASAHMARLDSLRQRILAARLFFYAGHADYVPAGGWQHRLHLQGQAGLLVGDILAMPRVPELVVLFACQSGRSDEETGGQEGLGVAQAFLWSGSQAVVASVRVVRNEVTAAVAEAFSARLRTGQAVNLGIELNRALDEVRKRPWSDEIAPLLEQELGAFRVFVR